MFASLERVHDGSSFSETTPLGLLGMYKNGSIVILSERGVNS